MTRLIITKRSGGAEGSALPVALLFSTAPKPFTDTSCGVQTSETNKATVTRPSKRAQSAATDITDSSSIIMTPSSSTDAEPMNTSTRSPEPSPSEHNPFDLSVLDSQTGVDVTHTLLPNARRQRLPSPERVPELLPFAASLGLVLSDLCPFHQRHILDLVLPKAQHHKNTMSIFLACDADERYFAIVNPDTGQSMPRCTCTCHGVEDAAQNPLSVHTSQMALDKSQY